MKRKQRIKLKASALAYAILISLLLSLITLSLMVVVQLHQHRMADITDMHQSVRNAQSGIELLLSDRNIARSGQMGLDLFGDGADSIFLSRRFWGGYEVLLVEARRGQHVSRKTVLAGSLVDENIKALVLTDKGKPLSLCGNTRIEGACLLPKSGVKRAYIEGRNYVGRELIYGTSETSAASLPNVSISGMDDLLSYEYERMDFGDVQVTTIDRSFTEPTLVMESFDFLDLSGMNFSGNVILRSETGMYIGIGTKLSRCILSAPRITVASGFIGDVQLYGDSIFIESGARLNYPSGIYVKDGFVSVAEGAMVIGQVVMQQKGKDMPLVSIESDASIYGMAHNEGRTQLKGSVFGTLRTNGFILKTASATYENHLLDATISTKELPMPYVSYVEAAGRLTAITDLK